MITINLSNYAAICRAKHAAECRDWYRKHRDKVNAKQRERTKRPDIAAQRTAYRRANKKHALEWRKEYTKTSKYQTWKDAHDLRKLYGLTCAQRDAMWTAQNGECALCCVVLESRGRGALSACIDHSHATGVVRAILCRLCNTGLGAFKDDPARLRAAAEYLERGVSP